MSSINSTLTLLELFRKVMPIEDATKAVSTIEEIVKDESKNIRQETTKTIETNMAHNATKADIAEVRTEIAGLRTELRTEIANSKIDTIKWMVSLLIGQTTIILGIIYFMIKSLK